MRRLLPILSLAAAALALTAAPAAARSNPYSPERVCGAGYSRVTHNPLTATSNQRVTIATAYLLYSRYTGKNCAVTLKARSIGKPTYTTAVIKKRGTGNPYDATVDHGYFSYFAGPVYGHARPASATAPPSRCPSPGHPAASSISAASTAAGWAATERAIPAERAAPRRAAPRGARLK